MDVKMNLERCITGLTRLGWDADMDDSRDLQHLEALVHEIAHNVILGDLEPKTMGETACMIRYHESYVSDDMDEIIATAITIQVCERLGYKEGTKYSLETVSANIRHLGLATRAEDLVIELLNTHVILKFTDQLIGIIEAAVHCTPSSETDFLSGT